MDNRIEDKLPASIKVAMSALGTEGYETYLVGGALRDLVMGRNPHDYDLATSASFTQICRVFRKQGAFTKGFKHDTVNVHFDDMDIEITSFRGNDPSSLKDDLEKRDFTINALAFSLTKGLVDELGSIEDIHNKIVKSCYSNPDDGIKDDPLRILRGIRFSGQYGFKVEKKTASSFRKLANLINTITPERVGDEFLKIIVLPCSDQLIREYFDVFSAFIPELLPMEGFNQRSSYHEFDVLEHSLHVLKAVKDRKPSICLAALFHDVGKPQSFFVKDGQGHFYGHDEKGEKITRSILTRLKYSNDLIEEVCSLIRWHMVQMEKKKTVKKMMGKLGNETFKELIELKEADIKGCSEQNVSPFPYIEALKKVYKEILVNKECFSLKDLAVNGDDLIGLGLQSGKQIGIVLNRLLDEVEEEKIKNNKEDLLKEAQLFLNN